MFFREDRQSLSPALSALSIAAGITALAFFLLSVSWGAPFATGPERIKAWGVDDESPLGPLAELHNIVYPKPNQWLSYPLLYSFLAAAAYAPYMLWQLMTGGLSGMSAAYPFGLKDPVTVLRTLTLLAHTVSAIMASLAVAAAFDIGRTLSGLRTGLLYSLLVTISFPLFYYARNGNVDATALAFTALACAAFCRAAVAGLSRERALWIGGFAGLALAAKESSIGALLLIPFLLVWCERQRGSSLRWDALLRTGGAGALAAFVAFGLGSGLFVDPRRYFAHVRYLKSLLDLVASSDTASAFTFPYTWAGHLGYLRATVDNAVDSLTVPGTVLLLTGVTCAFAIRSRAVLPALLAAGYAGYLFASYRLVQVRYLMPFVFLALFYVAYAVSLAWRCPAKVPRALGLMLGLLTIGRSALTAVEYTYQMRNDSRHQAAAWIAQHSRAGDTISHFAAATVLPAIPAGVKTHLATEYHNMYVRHRVDDAKVHEVLDGWRQVKPAFILVMPDHTSPPNVPYSITMPPQLYSSLLAGEAGYTLVASFQTPPLFRRFNVPRLDYPIVNPPIRIFAPARQVSAEAR